MFKSRQHVLATLAVIAIFSAFSLRPSKADEVIHFNQPESAALIDPKFFY